ncbi:MAG: SulP family inorganic anion transporter [Phycisphaeraceae bacterium]
MTVQDMMYEGKQADAIKKTAIAQIEAKDQRLAESAVQAGLAEADAPIDKRVIKTDEVEAQITALPADDIEKAKATIKTEDAKISGGLPIPYFLDGRYKDVLPPMNLETLTIIFPVAIILMGVGLIESLMTLSLIDEITETRGRGNRECVGQGVANITCGVFGGMGGCAMIGQSLINVNSGGRHRLSGVVAALLLLAFILFLGPWIGMIPMAALVGVMFMVVIGTFEWASLKMFRRMPWTDVIVMLTVVAITVFKHNLALAVLVGVIMSALVFAWNHATHLFADVKLNEHGSKVYQLHGPLFFASVESFKQLFNPADDPDDVVIDFYYTRVYDQSGLEAINAVADKYRAQGKQLHLVHLSEECAALLDKAGDFVEVNISEDPHYHVATDRLG